MKTIFRTMFEKFKKIDVSILTDIFFGLLILMFWNHMGSSVRIAISAMDGGLAKVLDYNSPVWCERSVGSMVKCSKYAIYTLEPIIILAALLYFKHKKLAFCCLFFFSLISACLFEIYR